MPENCYVEVFGVKKFVLDVKIAKTGLLYGENLNLNLKRAQLLGQISGCRCVAATIFFFSSVSTLLIVFENINSF